ncbi:hypothetical protein GH714_015922 [Hevea brasiliensis]|uniref:Plastocyanin-like domain-containing protein n=1 Tax=Hevea brasiliensis TaxID=3981 RepID=A0A6A6M0C3_HEVBR|nr:hypothetical protein GH714_015922 [Hevea brasiliensis]
MPLMPATNDTPTAHKFYSNLTGLAGGPHWVPVPRQIDEHMFVTVGVGLAPCGSNATCPGPFGQRFSASMNNESFQLPTGLSMLQAFFFNVSGVYTPNFPDAPPVKFDYTNANISSDLSLLFTPKSTSAKVLKYNATVQIVLQNTALLAVENHPIHIHGFNFHVLAQGFGNYDPVNDPKSSILSTHHYVTHWSPCVWFMHCHLDVHLPWGLATAFVVQNGPTPGSTLPPPPADLPKC